MRSATVRTMFVFALACASLSVVSHAADITTNGAGGGRWGDSTTWHGGVVPGTEDVAVIAMRDAVVFDGNDVEKATCKELYIDPEGSVTLRTAAGEDRCTLSVAGIFESYGIIRIDGSQTPRANYELRLIAPGDGDRVLKLQPGAGLLVYGAKDLPENGRNVRITAPAPLKDQPHVAAAINAVTDVMLDIHNAQLNDIQLSAASLDNTGAKANQRLNIIDNLFYGVSRIQLGSCDTPNVRGNHFDTQGQHIGGTAFVRGDSCKLVQHRNNTFVGSFDYGIIFSNDTDSAITGNTITGAGSANTRAIYYHGRNGMIQNNRTKDCFAGMRTESAIAVVENLSIDNCNTAVEMVNSNLQFTTMRINGIAEGGFAMSLNTSTATLLNCNVADDRIKLENTPAAGQTFFIAAMQYLMVKVSGQYPQGSVVSVKTADVSGGVQPGKADLNVRNSPARLNGEGLTSLPKSSEPLVVHSWRIGADQKRVTAPFYDISVIAPPSGDAPGQTLKTVRVEPSNAWFRDDPESAVPTVEVSVP